MKRKFALLSLILLISAYVPVFSVNERIVSRLIQAACAEGSAKIKSINFDNSDSIIFLGLSGVTEPSNIKVTKKTLEDRVFIDIENAITTFPAKTFELKNSKLTKIKITQNTLSPDTVRVVLWNALNYNPENIRILNVKNNIIIKLDNVVPEQKYLTRVYSETKDSSFDYFDKTVISQSQSESKQESDEIFNSVQQAFKDNSQELVRPNIEQKQARLTSRFFLDKIGSQNGNVVISGIGVINVSKPMILQEPARVVFDLPNTIVKQELRDKEFIISGNTTAKIGQFTSSTARIVIKSDNVNSFAPVYSKSLNTLVIGSNVQGFVTSEKSVLTYFKEDKVNRNTDVVNLTFSAPVIYSIKRQKNSVNILLYNLERFDVNTFNNIALANKNGFSAKQTGSNAYTITIPLDNNSYIDCYEALDAKKLRFVISAPVNQISSPEIKQPVQNTHASSRDKASQSNVRQGLSVENLMENQKKDKKYKNNNNKKSENAAEVKLKHKVIIIDPGHGGNDTGAQRNGILEKDLTLQIALKVRDILVSKGFKNVVMTRSEDKTLTLQDRVDISNNRCANMYVSIHINASVKPEITGVETHYWHDSGYEVAKAMHKELMSKLTVNDRGLFKSRFYVINHTEAPSVLLELGFISNEHERRALTSEQRQNASAEAVAEGIINYLTEHLDE